MCARDFSHGSCLPRRKVQRSAAQARQRGTHAILLSQWRIIKSHIFTRQRGQRYDSKHPHLRTYTNQRAVITNNKKICNSNYRKNDSREEKKGMAKTAEPQGSRDTGTPGPAAALPTAQGGRGTLRARASDSRWAALGSQGEFSRDRMPATRQPWFSTST